MKHIVLTAAVLALAPITSALAADQDVAFASSVKPKADAALHATLPEDILKKGYIVAGTNPNTPPTTFYQADNKTWPGARLILSARLLTASVWPCTGVIPGALTTLFLV